MPSFKRFSTTLTLGLTLAVLSIQLHSTWSLPKARPANPPTLQGLLHAGIHEFERTQSTPKTEQQLEQDRSTIAFYLYTDPTDPESRTELKIGNVGALRSGGFDRSAPTKIITHGFLSDAATGPGTPLKDAYLARATREGQGSKVNIILVDWRHLARSQSGSSSQSSDISGYLYSPPAGNTETVGRHTAKLIDFLLENGDMDLNSVHLIGHSLGAHVMGWAARSVRGFSRGQKIPRITALDPASPCFEVFVSFCPSKLYQSVSKDDTDFLDVIHTHTSTYGYTKDIGHADFYPNSGVIQPGCSVGAGLSPCSHSRAIDLMVESIGAPAGFLSRRCSSWSEFEDGNCDITEPVVMGEYCPKNARGLFYLETTSQSPFRLEAVNNEGTLLTREGYWCKDSCGKRGEKYYWCRKADDDWDYCAPTGQDYYGKECADGCQRRGKSYKWCNLKEGSWGYCSLSKE